MDNNRADPPAQLPTTGVEPDIITTAADTEFATQTDAQPAVQSESSAHTQQPELQQDDNSLPSVTDTGTGSKKGQLASRSHRLIASLIDSFIQLLVFIPLIWYVGLETFKSPTPLQTLLIALYGMTTYVLLHGYLLYHYGQTIGKSEFGMRIELLNGDKASLQHVMLWRYLPIMLLNFVPVIGQFLSGIFNVLFIFGKERRCLHDYIAGTRVRYFYDEPDHNPQNNPS